MVISGIGFGFFQTPNNRALLGSAPRERAGAVGALQAVMRVFGQTVGAAIVATAFTLSPTDNPIWGLVVACFFGLVALVINVHRHLKTQGAQV
jgi:DHA2 family multidrug resistance protein-like MFS transporter